MQAETRIAVFGGSEPGEDSPVYATARTLGRLLAREGFTVLTGGYGGVMEAASRGSQEGGGRAVGVTCSVFDHRSPNPFLDEAWPSQDLYERTRKLIEQAHGYVILPGRSGTLAELAQVWALQRASCLSPRPVVLLDETWVQLLGFLRERKLLDPVHLELLRIATSAEEALDCLRPLRGTSNIPG